MNIDFLTSLVDITMFIFLICFNIFIICSLIFYLIYLFGGSNENSKRRKS